MDKFLITTRRVEPVKYTFFTVVMGALLLLLWPWSYVSLPLRFIFFDLISGALFSLAMYVFFVALSEGEVSRVVPFVFGLVPVFDVLISLVTGRNVLQLNELAAVCLLIPGALLVSHKQDAGWLRHAGLKTLSAFLFSCYYALWQYAAQTGPTLNNLMWNRLGAAAICLLLLVWPAYRFKVFAVEQIKNKGGTSVLFIFKQVLGGANFIFLSFLFVLGKIPVINALQGFRYAFVLFLTYLMTRYRSHMLAEKIDAKILTQKIFGIALIFLGTIFLFI